MNEGFIWAYLLHLGHNMWKDIPRKEFTPELVSEKNRGDPEKVSRFYESCMTDELLTVEAEWDFAIESLAKTGCNLVIVDLGESVRYASHPELAVKGSWTVERLREKLARIRALGMEPIPKLNFSATHDTWLKDYHRMVSTPEYFRVCSDLIREVAEIFDRPRFFHLGYDEETYAHQKRFRFVVVRQGEQWWHDFLWFVKETEKTGCRPWVWSDYAWKHKDFLSRCPKSVLQSNWYYGERGAIGDEFDLARLPESNPGDGRPIREYVKTYLDLDKAGFEQVPTGSTYLYDTNFANTIRFCDAHCDPKLLKGYMMAPWLSPWTDAHAKNAHAFEVFKSAIAARERTGA